MQGGAVMDSYEEFLKSKRVAFEPSGFDCPDINANLFDFQRDIVGWALKKGKAAIFSNTGTGKTRMQLAYADCVVKHTKGNVLILAPLAVNRQTVQEGHQIGIKVNLCRKQEDVLPGINITNYEMLEHFDPESFQGVVLDESSILKSYNGTIRTKIIEAFQNVPFRLACTATPAPNDFSELGNHAEFLGIMRRPDMLATFFVHDSKPDNHDGEGFGSKQKWRLKGHAVEIFWSWVASWAVMMQKPEDLGYTETSFELPPLNFHQVVVDEYGFEAKTIQDRIKARADSIEAKIPAIVELLTKSPDDKWLLWCGLNKEADILKKAIGNAIEVRGSDTPERKAEVLLNFANGEIPILITKAQIAGFGMNLQVCHKMAFVGLSDSFEEMYQAVRRCWRFGQKSPVDVYVITSVAEGAVVRNIEAKEKRFSEMLTGMISATQEINKANIGGATREYDEYKQGIKTGNNWEMRLGDSCKELLKLDSATVHYSIFSPPFQNIFVYSNSNRDVGNSRDKAEFKKHMAFVAEQLYRVLIPGRLISIHCSDLPAFKYKEGYIGLRDFPAMCREIFEEAGFIYHSKVTVYKSPVTEMYRTKTIGLLYQQLKKDSALSRQGLADYIITMRKPGDNPIPITHTGDDFPLPMWQKYADPVWMDILTTNTLNSKSAREYQDEKHICPLQLDLIERCLELWSNPGEVVLSPFAGIGSEGYTSLKMGRKFIGIELKESYFNQACDYLSQVKQTGSEQADLFRFEESKRPKQAALKEAAV